MRIIPREEWGAVCGDGRWQSIVPAPMVALHHSVTVAPDLVSPYGDDYAAIRAIERYGMEMFGEVYGFPYTWGVTPAGLVFEGHDPAKMGAHTGGLNDRARAIVLVGNYEEIYPTGAQKNAVAWLLRQAHADGWIARPQIAGGHGQLPGQATLCPGRHALAAIPEINRLAATGGTLTTEDEEEDEVKLYLVWDSEVDTSPLLLAGGTVTMVVDPDSVEAWEGAGAVRVPQTHDDYERLRRHAL